VGLLKYIWVHIFLRGPPKKISFPAGFGKKKCGSFVARGPRFCPLFAPSLSMMYMNLFLRYHPTGWVMPNFPVGAFDFCFQWGALLFLAWICSSNILFNARGRYSVVVLMTPGGGFFLSASFQMHLFLGACDVDGVSGTFRLNWSARV
jgi:hypothetical protein